MLYIFMKEPKVNYFFTIIAAYGTMFLYGLISSIRSVSLPMLKESYSVSYESQGALVSISWLGYVIFALFISMLIIRIGTRKVLIIGYTIMLASLASTFVVSNFGLSMSSLFVMSIGISFFDLGSNALGSITFTKKSALMMNVVHFFYGFGAILGPIFAGVITKNIYEDWRAPYIFSLPFVAAMLIFILVSKFKTNEVIKQKTFRSSFCDIKQMLQKPLLWLFAIMLGMFSALGMLITEWGGLYLQDVYDMDAQTTGAAFVAFFFVALTVSRLLSGFVVEKVGYLRSITWASIFTFILLVFGVSFGKTGLWIFPLIGIPIGIVFPTVVAIVMNMYPDKASTIVSTLLILQCIIYTGLQYVIGLVNEYIGSEWGFRTSIIYIFIAMALIYTIKKYGKNKGYVFE